MFGDALQAYLTKKVASLEELFMQQLEVFVSIIADSHGDFVGGIDELNVGSDPVGGEADGPPGGQLLSKIALEKVCIRMLLLAKAS